MQIPPRSFEKLRCRCRATSHQAQKGSAAVPSQDCIAEEQLTLFPPEEGVAPGQACVFYSDDAANNRVLGGGWIAETGNMREAAA